MKRIPLDSWQAQKIHRGKVAAKLQKIQTLQALLQQWESHPYPDHYYIAKLRRRIRSLENQYNNMQP